jgi:hypothetical protein
MFTALSLWPELLAARDQVLAEISSTLLGERRREMPFFVTRPHGLQLL